MRNNCYQITVCSSGQNDVPTEQCTGSKIKPFEMFTKKPYSLPTPNKTGLFSLHLYHCANHKEK